MQLIVSDCAVYCMVITSSTTEYFAHTQQVCYVTCDSLPDLPRAIHLGQEGQRSSTVPFRMTQVPETPQNTSILSTS